MITPPIPDPQSAREGNNGIDKHELREMLGLTPADLLTYIALFGGGVALYFASNLFLDVAISLASIVCMVFACRLGMKRDERVSQLTNVVKLISYPVALVFMLGIIAVNFVWWNNTVSFGFSAGVV